MNIPSMNLAPEWAEYLVLGECAYWWVNYTTGEWSFMNKEGKFPYKMREGQRLHVIRRENIPVIHQLEND